jgi:hypothetical protein
MVLEDPGQPVGDIASGRTTRACAYRSRTVPGGEHGERDFPKVTVPPLDPDNRKKEW